MKIFRDERYIVFCPDSFAGNGDMDDEIVQAEERKRDLVVSNLLHNGCADHVNVVFRQNTGLFTQEIRLRLAVVH